MAVQLDPPVLNRPIEAEDDTRSVPDPRPIEPSVSTLAKEPSSGVSPTDPLITGGTADGGVAPEDPPAISDVRQQRTELVHQLEACTAQRANEVERTACLHLLVDAFYPTDHPQLHLVDGKLNLSQIGPVGRTDEIGRLRKVALAVPHALAGEWRFSPMAKAHGFQVDLYRALEQHAALTQCLLNHGVEVHLVLQPDEASEAVYATDTVTGFLDTVLIGNPKYPARKLETAAYVGGLRLEVFGKEEGPIEFGDLQFYQKGNVVTVLQGYNSWRGTPASIEAMGQAITQLQRSHPDLEIHHLPVELSGEDTLHLDYVLGYSGEGDQRVMVVHPESYANPKMVDRLAELLEVPSGHVISVSKEQMLAGACNLENLDPQTVLMIKNEQTAKVAEQMRSFGLTVIELEYDQMSQKDGTVHCSVGQLGRDP